MGEGGGVGECGNQGQSAAGHAGIDGQSPLSSAGSIRRSPLVRQSPPGGPSTEHRAVG